MAEKELNVIAARLSGKEREEDYARTMHDVSASSLAWQILKGRFGRLVLINLIMAVFFAPLVAIVVWRWLWVYSQGLSGIYSSGLTVGPWMLPSVIGAPELSMFEGDLFYLALLFPALAIAAVGLAGGAYHIHVLLRTEGVFVFMDFWRGVKRNYLPTLEAVLLFGVFLYAARILGDLAQFHMAVGGSAWLMILSQIVGYTLFAVAAFVSMWMISIAVSYERGPWTLFVDAVIMTFRTFPFTLIFGALASALTLLSFFGGSFFATLAMFCLLFFGIVVSILIWMTYAQWAFDRYIGVGEVRTESGSEREKDTGKKETPEARPAELGALLVAYGKSVLLSRPMQPIDEGETPALLPETYGRAELGSLARERARIKEQAEKFAADHAQDAGYAEYNRLFREREQVLPSKKKKSAKPPKMLTGK